MERRVRESSSSSREEMSFKSVPVKVKDVSLLDSEFDSVRER